MVCVNVAIPGVDNEIGVGGSAVTGRGVDCRRVDIDSPVEHDIGIGREIGQRQRLGLDRCEAATRAKAPKFINRAFPRV